MRVIPTDKWVAKIQASVIIYSSKGLGADSSSAQPNGPPLASTACQDEMGVCLGVLHEGNQSLSGCKLEFACQWTSDYAGDLE